MVNELRSKVVTTLWRSTKDDRAKVGGLREATAMLPAGMIRWSIGFKTVNIAQAGGGECVSGVIANKKMDEYLISASEITDSLSRVTLAA
jgi:hypothetical protein